MTSCDSFKVLVFCVCCIACPLPAQVLFQAEARDTIKISRAKDTGATITEEQRVSFEHLALFDNAAQVHYDIVAKLTLTTARNAGQEGSQSSAKVDFHFSGADGKFPTEASRTITVPNVHQVDFRDDHWIATTHGCCGAENYSRLYSFKGDSPFLRFNGNYAKVEVPNSGITRYVGAVVRSQVVNDAADDAIFGANKTAVAAITYGAPGKPMTALLLEPKTPPGASKKVGGEETFDSSLMYSTEGIRVASASAKDETYDPDFENLPVELRMFSLDPVQDGQGHLKAPTGISGVTITASFYTADGTTETVSARVEDDKITAGKMSGNTLRAVAP